CSSLAAVMTMRVRSSPFAGASAEPGMSSAPTPSVRAPAPGGNGIDFDFDSFEAAAVAPPSMAVAPPTHTFGGAGQ
ncbi:unnamed protein product, partial [Polarella glacialis]